jgi:two-component system, cell cycle sensor histidine kinase and response regulator CckA
MVSGGDGDSGSRLAPAEQPGPLGLEPWVDVLFDTCSAAIGVVSVSGNRYLRANAALAELYGMSLEALLEADPFGLGMRLAHPDDLPAEQRLFAELVAGTRRFYRVEKRYVRPDGTVRWGLMTFSGLFAPAEQGSVSAPALVGAVVHIVDTTEHKALQETLVLRDAELRHAQKVDALGRLAAGVAHDFNNLLTVIIGHSEVLRQELARADRAHTALELNGDIAAISEAAERAAGLTAQLLAYGRREIAAPRRLILSEQVATLEQLLRRTLGADVEIEQQLEATGAVFADPGQLGQVIMNLILNARDALGASGRIRLATRDVVGEAPGAAREQSVEEAAEPATRPGAWVVLSVSDDGHGMSDEVKARMFEPFFTTRADRPGMQGTGLGLATVQRVANDAGARIAVESAPGRGTTVSVFFPRAEPPPALAPAAAKALATHPGGRKVLVVEDEPSVRSLVATVLLGARYWVSVARDGAEGLEVATREAKPFDLIITDLMMPQLSGLALVKRLHELGHKPRVLYISGYTDEAAAELASYGKLLPKPFTPAKLLAAVAEALGEEGG